MPGDPNQSAALRAALRDLVALSTIPAAWVGREPAEISAGLADVLVGSLGLDFAFVRLRDPKSGAAVEATRGDAWRAFPKWLESHRGRLSRSQVISDAGDPDAGRRIVIPIGVDGEGGLVAAACARSDFPSELDHLLLSIAANHAATAFQNAELIDARRRAEEALRQNEHQLRQARDELEMKVTERTAELGRSEAYLAEAQRLTHTGSWAVDANTRQMIHSSDEHSRLFGLDPAQGLPALDTLVQRMHPEDRARTIGTLEQALAQKTDFEVNCRLVFPDGTVKHVQGFGHPVFDASGELVRMVGTSVDVTERRRADEERERLLLRERAALAKVVAGQRRFEDLVNSVEGIVWEADASTFQFSFVSKQAERVLGFPVECWLSEPTFWSDHLHPDDRGWAAAYRVKATAEKRDHDFEYRMSAADGGVVWLRDIATVVVEGGRATRLRGVMVDITERRRAEYLTRQVFESSPDAVAIVGRDYRYRRVNPVYERRTGIPEDEIVGMHVAELMGAEAFERLKLNLDRCFAGEEVSFGDWISGPGWRKYLSASYSPLRPDSERVEAVLVINRDLTEHMLASEALQKAQADLAYMSRVTTMGELTASLAHEVNQPITAAVTNANTCMRWLNREDPDLKEARDAVTRMVKDVTRAAEIVKHLRSLFRKDATQRERIEVNEIIREMILLLRGETTRHSISLRADLDPRLPPVMGDRVQLQQVLMNLMLNAIEAMGEANGTRELTIKSERDGAGQLLISVSDTGVGLPSESADQIFNPFFSTKPKGTGMGLSITRSIVESHGGRLWAQANAGPGTTFSFSLPTAAEGSMRPAAEPASSG